MKVVVVGGGISGLSVAWFAHRQGLDVRLLESSDRIGGSIATIRENGWLLELGPNTVLQKPGRDEDAVGRLIDQVGLSSRLRIADPAGAKRFVLRRDRLRPLPGTPQAFLTTDVFSWQAKLRLLGEPFVPRGKHEETIAEFVIRRLGREFLHYAVDPFVSGVFAGDPGVLSVRAAVPRIYEVEQRYGSLIRGAMKLGRATRNAGQPAGRQISFDAGLAVLPEAIAASLPAGSVVRGRAATGIRRLDGRWEVECDGPGGSESATHLVLAAPSIQTAALLEPLIPEASVLLREIPYSPVISVAVGYARTGIAHPLDGFGFLAPRCEGMRTLGALFSSTLFEDRAPDGHVLLTAFLGGTTDPEAVCLGDDAILEQVERDLGQTVGSAGAPAYFRVTRYPRAIPQYELGHLERLAAIRRNADSLPGLHLCGSWGGGISVADCVRSAELLAARLAPTSQGSAP